MNRTFLGKFSGELKVNHGHLNLRTKLRWLCQLAELGAKIQMTLISLQFTEKFTFS